MKARRGFTLIELAIVVAIIGILAAVGVAVYKGQDETSYARIAESVQASLQSTITQASARQEKEPLALDPNAVKNALSLNLGRDVLFAPQSGNQFKLTFADGTHKVVYQVTSSGEVRIIDLPGFSKYRYVDGVIKPI